MNLNKDETNLGRVLKWNGKSLALCSRKELIDCVVAQASTLGQMQQKIDELEKRSEKEMVAENAT